MDWQLVAPLFDNEDGNLRDIYILDTSIADWQRMWQGLRDLEPPPAFSIDGIPQPMPNHVASLFAERAEHSPLLSITIGNLLFNCHFFGDDEIEFDCDAREVKGPQEARSLAAFMQMLGDLTDRPVILTFEEQKGEVIARYVPTTNNAVWMPWAKEIPISSNLTEEDFETLSAEWDASDTASISLESLTEPSQIESLINLMMTKCDHSLAMVVLAELAEMPDISMISLKKIFALGDTGCRVSVCLRPDLDDELRSMCEASEDPNVIEHYSLKSAARSPVQKS